MCGSQLVYVYLILILINAMTINVFMIHSYVCTYKAGVLAWAQYNCQE